MTTVIIVEQSATSVWGIYRHVHESAWNRSIPLIAKQHTAFMIDATVTHFDFCAQLTYVPGVICGFRYLADLDALI